MQKTIHFYILTVSAGDSHGNKIAENAVSNIECCEQYIVSVANNEGVKFTKLIDLISDLAVFNSTKNF